MQTNDTCGSRTIISMNEEQVNERECCIFQRKYLTAPNQQPYDTAGMDSESILYVEKYFREDSSRVRMPRFLSILKGIPDIPEISKRKLKT